MTTLIINTAEFSYAATIIASFMCKEGVFKERMTFESTTTGIVLKATDYIESGEINIPLIDNSSFDAFSVNGKDLLTILKVVKKDEVTLEINNDSITIKHGRSKANIELFAEPQHFEKEDQIINTISISKHMLDAFKNAEHSVTVDRNNKPALNGILLDNTADGLNIVSTDTRRLTVQSLIGNANISKNILPKEAIRSILKFAKVDSQLFITNSSFFIKSNSMFYSCKKISADYPTYEKIIPKSYNNKIDINKDTFISIIKEVSLFEPEIDIKIANGKILAADAEQKCTTVENISDTTANIEFRANSKYILDFLSIVDEDTVQICFNDANLPFSLVYKNIIEIIMPIVKNKS